MLKVGDKITMELWTWAGLQSTNECEITWVGRKYAKVKNLVTGVVFEIDMESMKERELRSIGVYYKFYKKEEYKDLKLRELLSQDVEYFSKQVISNYKNIPSEELQGLVDNMELILNKYKK